MKCQQNLVDKPQVERKRNPDLSGRQEPTQESGIGIPSYYAK